MLRSTFFTETQSLLLLCSMRTNGAKRTALFLIQFNTEKVEQIMRDLLFIEVLLVSC